MFPSAVPCVFPLLDKLFSSVVVQRQVPVLVRTLLRVARETPQAHFLDEVMGITTGFTVQTVRTVWRCR